MAVLGDSTGNEDSEWVHLLTLALAEKTGRPAEVHTWSVDTESYGMPKKYTGDGEPIIVWNASAPGKHTGYSLDHCHDMVPQRPDMLIVNHGHNQADARDTSEEVQSIANWARTSWRQPPALAVTLQNPRTDALADEHARIVARLRQDVPAQGAAILIDVFSAFEASHDVSALLRPDGFHPSDAGETLWADVAWRSLGLHEVLP
ncbi:SGNH/GDSL hydrolase family protein [Kocuria arenosa]|uniref:SGNH/GDSL hydrolase family protein n=1 Tax=Kocuria arenosa TaxID=3071446 RepID=UPI0034D6C803